MKEDARGHPGLDLRRIKSNLVSKARPTRPGNTQGYVTGKEIPFPVPDCKPPAAEARGQDSTRVQELKARIQSGRYRISCLRLAGKMIRESLLDDLSCRKRGSLKAEQ